MVDAKRAETGFADVNGTRLYYEVAGTGHPLVLVHAGIADHTMWDDQFHVFAQCYRVVRYDARGFGQTPIPPGPFSFSNDLHTLLQHLNIDHAVLVGVSMGGSTVVDFALEYPEMVDALILVGSGVGGSDITTGAEDEWEAIEALDKQGQRPQAIAKAIQLDMRLWVDGPNRSSDKVDPTFRQRAQDMVTGRYSKIDHKGVLQPLDPPAITRLSEINVPTLIIVGDEDVPAIQQLADRLAMEISNAQKVVMHNTTHLPNMEQPNAFNRIVWQFLNTLRS
jgi:pimeloyl-ACP methyl ester carboxylesterase